MNEKTLKLITETYPNIDKYTADILSYWGSESECIKLMDASNDQIVIVSNNRDGEVADISYVATDLYSVDMELEDLDNYEGPWGDYRTVVAIIYKQTSYHYKGTSTDRSLPNLADIDDDTISHSLSRDEIKTALIEAIRNTESYGSYWELKTEIEQILAKIN